MSYTSKFTERFDINPSDSVLQEIIAPPSPKSSSVYSSPDLGISDSSLQSQTSTKTTPIAIPQKNKRSISVTPPCSPPSNSEKHQDALASKFKHFLNSISKKRDRSSSVTSSVAATAISTK